MVLEGMGELGKAFSLHAANLGLPPRSPQGPLSPTSNF